MKKYPVVYYYKEDLSLGEDLKYSIRSVVKNFPYSKIILLGDKPSWFRESEKFIYIPSKNIRSSGWTIGWVPFQHMNNLIRSNHPAVDFDEFILFNDDFFVTKKVTEFEDFCRSSKDYNLRAKANRVYHTRTRSSLKLTESKLYFNLHCPMRMKISNLRILIKDWLSSPIKDLDFRTWYGNRFIKDYSALREVDDFKSSYLRLDLLDPELREYYSTSSQDFVKGSESEGAKKLKKMFPVMSPCERTLIKKVL